MKNLRLIVASVLILLFTSGCGISAYRTHNQNQNQTSVVLSGNNYKIVKTVEARVSSTYFFGMGGLSRSSLRDNAVSELTRKANLTGSQALVNVTFHVNAKFILPWWRRTVVAHGTVIEFMDK